MFGLRKSQEGEIALDAMRPPPGAWEIARLWVSHERSFVLTSHDKKWQPELFGSLLVECIHTAAVAFAKTAEMTETEALERIWQGLDAERTNLDGKGI